MHRERDIQPPSSPGDRTGLEGASFGFVFFLPANNKEKKENKTSIIYIVDIHRGAGVKAFETTGGGWFSRED